MADSEKPQIDKFRDLARELECDEDDEAFKAKLRQVAKPRPQPERQPDDS